MNTRKNTGNARLALMVIIAVVAVTIGFITAGRLVGPAFDPAGFRSVRVLPEPKVISDFRLETAGGEAFTAADLEGQWTLVFFGFANCPDVCPTALFNLADVEQRLTGEATTPHVLFVSVDPDRDRGETLDQYTHYFSPSFTGVTGDDPQLQLLTRQLGVVYARQAPEEPGGDYSVDHTAAILLLDPDVRLHAVLPAPHDSEVIASELGELLAHRSQP